MQKLWKIGGNLKMTITEKPPLGIIPRHLWLRNRVNECLDELRRLGLEESNDWDSYLKKAADVAAEIKYATEEWDKYYCEHGISGTTKDGQKFCADTIVLTGVTSGGGGSGK